MLAPDDSLVKADPARPELWRSLRPDARFNVRSTDGQPMPAGWYVLRANWRASEGKISAPALYPDYGEGILQEHTIFLPVPDASGDLERLVLLKYPALYVQFRPTSYCAEFGVERFELRRIGRKIALWIMLWASARDYHAGRSLGLLLALRGFIGAAAKLGVSTAAETLFQRYGEHQEPSSGSYEAWVMQYDQSAVSDRREYQVRIDGLFNRPLISILLPVYNTPERWLRRCIESVCAQVYPNWELCIVDDASTAPHVQSVLQEYISQDNRIRVSRREKNGHISAASNTALEMVRGHFVALLDHDDELRPHALLEIAESIVNDPEVEFIYSDEDKIDESGNRSQPYFKPDWNPDLLLSQNYLCHFTAIRTSLVREAGGFRLGFEGSQDHDLFLRCVEHLKPSQIHHIPKILYHWRAIPGSTALERQAKDYAASAGLRAVTDHLQRIRSGAIAHELPHGHYRVSWPLPDVPPKVSIIVPTRDKAVLLKACVDSLLLRTEYPDFEVLIVDNQSIEPQTQVYLEEIQMHPAVRVLRYDQPFNYSAINNWAVSQCDGTVLCLLNNDIEAIDAGWLNEMVSHACRPGIGAVGAMLYYPDRTIQHAGVILGIGGVANHAYTGQPAGYPGHGARALVVQNLSAVTGACLVVRRDAYEAVGGLDEHLKVAFNDIDFCLRLDRAGYRNVWTPFAELIHHESASRGNDDTPERRARFLAEVDYMLQRWGKDIQQDPAYNPNLSLQGVNSELAFPPRQT